MKRIFILSSSAIALAACQQGEPDPRGVAHDETLLSVSATGRAETRPDQARFEAGVTTYAGSARAASQANAEKMNAVIAALQGEDIEEKDMQTRTVGVQKMNYGPNKGQYQASNIVTVTVRDIDKAGDAVTAATEAGANVVSGPDLRLSDPEKAANSAYGEAYRAARARAEAYAAAADLEIARVLTIRDGGGYQGPRPMPAAPPPPVVRTQAVEQSAAIMPGQTTSEVSVQVDFALTPKD